MQKELKMCIVNLEIVNLISSIAGSQMDIMSRIGISWNSWIKIVGGLPVRLTVGERLRSRVVGQLYDVPGPSGHAARVRMAIDLDRSELERIFLKPVTVQEKEGDHIRRLRSVKRARAIATHNHHVRITQSRASWHGEIGVR